MTKKSISFPATFFIMLLMIIIATSLQAGEQNIRIMHFNDFHGFATEHKFLGSEKPQGGIAYAASYVKKMRKEKPTLLLAAGDMIQGNTWANLFYGKPVVEVMNSMGFDAMVVGNHEFDFGQKVLNERIKEAVFPFLGANVVGLAGLQPYTIKEIGGVKTAIIGVVTEDVPTTTHPSNVAGLTFLSTVDTVEKYVRQLRGTVDLIIVLTHIGFDADMMLANRVKGIDIIVGGHSHTKTERHMVVGNTIIVQAWEHALAIGVLDITIDDGRVVAASGKLQEITPDHIKKNDEVAAIVARYETQVKNEMGKIIGEASCDLDGEMVRLKETNLGDFIADIIRRESGAQAAIINGGGLRTSIRKGEITVNDVYSVLPFNNYIVAIELTGEQVRQALEHGVSAVERKEGQFPQVSGIVFSYDRTKKPGSRISTIRINNEILKPEGRYTVATNDFLAAGGDGYQVFRDALKDTKDFSTTGGILKGSRIVYNDTGRWLRDIVVRHVSAQKIISSSTEGRIKETSDNESLRK